MEAAVLGWRKPLSLAAISPPPVENVDSERCLLGAMMRENSIIETVADIVRADDFADEFYAGLFQLVVNEQAKGRLANPVTLKVHFDTEVAKDLAQMTGSDAAVVGVVGARGLASQIADLARRRRMIAGLREVISGAHDYENPTEQLAAAAEAALSEAFSEDEGGKTSIGAGDAIAEFVDSLNEPDHGVISGIIPSLDAVLGKLRPADLCIVAGRPGMGKTTLAQSYSLGAVQGGHGVLFVSLEMHKRQLAAKFACDYLFDGRERIPFSALTERSLAPNQRIALARSADQIRDLPLVIEDLPGATIGKLARIVRRQARRFAAKGTSLDLVVIDYLQLLDADDPRLDIRSAVTKISRGLKNIAKANGVAIMALAQLNRKVEDRADKRPHTADLRESGQIEQDADQIVFLLRREKYLRAEEPKEGTADWHEWRTELDKHTGRIEFIVAKNRHSVEGSAHGDWHGAFQAVRG